MTEPRGARRLTVQGWQILVLSVMGAVVLAGAVATGMLMNRTDDVSSELVDDIQPARVAAYQLQAALRDQETALRGYAIAADRQFLEPYFDGQRTERSAADDIRSHLGYRRDAIEDLDAIEKAAANWRTTYADPLIASVTPGAPAVVDNATAERGKAEFDRLRTLFDVQNAHLSAARQVGVDELAGVRAWRDRVLAGLIAAFFGMAILLAVLVRSAVTRPLGALAASCRRITEGNFGERIVPRGPKDIRGIAADVEDMRQRIVEELDASRAAREALDEQTVELRRSNAELEQFAYVASHDLQEPLRKVASFCQLLEKRYGDKLDERGTEYIAFAVDGAKRMQVLINDLLTFSRVGRLNAASTEVDLDAALDTALGNLSTAIEETGAQIVRPEAGLPRVHGDPTLLVMVWQNLIGNAVKFRRDGVTPRIVIECDQRDRDDQSDWIFTVSDNGIGIPKEFADKVFVIFQRLHGRDSYSGTGIGLALCKKIVEHHGGNIWIDTSYTEGTRFRFTLPVFTPSIQSTAEPGLTPAAIRQGVSE
ncbi:MAG TPA: CHASE3 domain-containing protein [Mycobacterium sp.]|nr:CHASE3 domain-containing protein [Mycobacterium sp.]